MDVLKVPMEYTVQHVRRVTMVRIVPKGVQLDVLIEFVCLMEHVLLVVKVTSTLLTLVV